MFQQGSCCRRIDKEISFMNEELCADVEQLVASLLEKDAIDLVGVEVGRQRARFVIRIFVDKPQGGITIEECAAVNKRISVKLEEDSMLSDDYILEVSSPGLDRLLKSEKDFLRVIHKKVKVLLSEEIGNKCEYAGTVDQVREGEIVISARDLPQGLSISIGKIKEAIQII